MLDSNKLRGVWSAAPSPLGDDMSVHVDDVRRMVDHHLRLGINGLFLAGTNGEGPCLPDRERRRLVKAACDHAQGRLLVAVQVTDNSSARIRDNAQMAAEDGADIAVIAPPNFFMNASPASLERHYIESIEASPLPVGIYDRGGFGPVVVPEEVLKAAYAHDKVVLIKDSSTLPEHAEMALAARGERAALHVLDGDEFHCVHYLELGYDGLLLGGGVFNGYLAGLIVQAVQAGDLERANGLQERMNRMMWDVYGGKDIACWLSGEKKLLVDMEILSTWKSHYNYPLTDSCIAAIHDVLERDADVLFP